MTLDITRLLGIPTWRAFDVDDEGRVLAGSDESGSVQLVEIDTDGTTAPLTALPGAVRGRYLPGERTVVVEHDTDGDERAQLSLLHLDGLSEPATVDGLVPFVRDSEYVHSLLDVLPGRVLYGTNRRNGVDFDVVVRGTTIGEEQVVYDRGGMVLDVAASPDSRYVAITLPGTPPLSEQLVLVNTMPATEDERVVALTDPSEPCRHTHVRWLPDDSGLLVTTNTGRNFTGVARLDPLSGKREYLVTSDEHDVVGWSSPDGRTVLTQTNVDGTARLSLHHTADGSLVHDIELPGEGWCASPMPAPVFSPDSTRAALSFTSPVVPGDVLLLKARYGVLEQLTDSAAALRGESLTEPTHHKVPAPDGETIPCLAYPPTSEPSGSAVVVIHGGPESQSVCAFNPVLQGLAAQGHAVIVPNVRGSTGYGKHWYSADDGRRRPDAVADLAAIHNWLPSQGIEPTRAALYGGSYGGYMVLAGMTEQPRRWAAGVDIVGMSSLVTFLRNTAGYRRAHREREYGSLTDDAEFLHQASPLTHVERVAAPLFVVHGANDPRVPLSEAEQLAESVRGKGIECELVVYPNEGHGLAQRTNRLDAYPRIFDFLARHLTR